MKRLYYVGTGIDFTDGRLPGMVLNYGNAVDVHDDELVEKLLVLSHFSDKIVSPRHVEVEAVQEDEPEEEWLDVVEEVPDDSDLEVDDDHTNW